jgi:hypothetical protein
VTDARRALIVANDQYAHPDLRRLLSPAADAEALAHALADPGIGDFAVEVVRNEAAHETSRRIEDFFAEGQPDDLLVLHFSGHGLKSDSGELFFTAANTSPTRLGSTAIPADFVQRCMRSSRSRSIVLLLDCCYGGAFTQGAQVRASDNANVLDAFPKDRLGGRGRAVITACNAMEYAFEGDRLADGSGQTSVFTTALVDGLVTGDADRDEDGLISINELYDFVFDRVRQTNPNQTPSRSFDLQGDLYLARSRRRRIRPDPIPQDLQAAVGDANMFTRLGAISELRGRLHHDNLPVAVAARDTLAQIAAADIQQVAYAAHAALAEIAIHPTDNYVRFQPVTQGATRPRHIIRLLGPPIARLCTHPVTPPWLRVTELPEGLEVSIDTNQLGDHRADITVTAATSQTTITIEALVTMAPQLVHQPVASPISDDARRHQPPTGIAHPPSTSQPSAADASPPAMPDSNYPPPYQPSRSTPPPQAERTRQSSRAPYAGPIPDVNINDDSQYQHDAGTAPTSGPPSPVRSQARDRRSSTGPRRAIAIGVVLASLFVVGGQFLHVPILTTVGILLAITIAVLIIIRTLRNG